jgi:hypothetical protein
MDSDKFNKCIIPLLGTNSAGKNVQPVALICGIADIETGFRFLGFQ